ncbi:MAG: hypothetical protein HKN48_05195 [Flavobacteriaceae bacterium]|nr:hypothetical protein [Flavobacteriaceae bacterium]
MELAKVETLLESYFEGQTSLEQENELRAFFATEEIPAHLTVYKPMFEGFQLAATESSQKEFQIPDTKKKSRYWTFGIAASFAVMAGIASFMFSQQGLSQEEQEALAAFKKTKEVMFLFSENLNKGTESVAHLDEFTKGTSNIALINEFTESKNRILK